VTQSGKKNKANEKPVNGGTYLVFCARKRINN